MKMMMVAAIAACTLAFVTGCEKEQTPAEKAQASIQQAAKDTKAAADKAAKDVKAAADKTAADAKKAAADAQKK